MPETDRIATRLAEECAGSPSRSKRRSRPLRSPCGVCQESHRELVLAQTFDGSNGPERPDRRRGPHRRCPEAHPTTCCLPSLPSCAIPCEMLTRLVERVWWNGSAPSVPRKLARFPVVSSEFQLILFGDVIRSDVGPKRR